MARLQGNSSFLETILKNIGELGSVPGRTRAYDPTKAALPIQQSASSADPGALAAAGIPSDGLKAASDAAALTQGGGTDSNGYPLNPDGSEMTTSQKTTADRIKLRDKLLSEFDNNLSQGLPSNVIPTLRQDLEDSVMSGDPTAPGQSIGRILAQRNKDIKDQPNIDALASQIAPERQEAWKLAMRGQPANVIENSFSQEVALANRRDPNAPARIDRTGMPDWTKGLTDADLSKLVLQQKQAEAEGTNSYWPRLKGQSLTLMNNDEFKRSGLRTGDTVCIKIP